MPSVWSKILMPEWSLPYNCYEIGHTWNTSCEVAALDMTLIVFKEAVKLYTPLYVFNAVIKRKFDRKAFQSLVINIFRSSAFLGFSALSMMTFFCNIRKCTGKFYYTLCAYLPVFVSSLMAIIIEKGSRRGPLAIYCANIASETLYRMLVNRKYIKPIPRGEVLLFTISVSLLLFTVKKNGYPKDPISFALKILLGREECPKSSNVSNEKSSDRKTIDFNDENDNQFEQQIGNQLQHNSRNYLASILKYLSARHLPCKHHNMSCALNGSVYFLRNFTIGWMAQVLMSTFMRPFQFFRSPVDVFTRNLFDKNNLSFGLFLGSFSCVYKLANCLLKWFTNQSEDWHSLVAAICAGPTMLFSRSPMNNTISLYLIWKCIETFYLSAVRKGWVAYKDQTIIGLYALSTAQLAYVTILEPGAMRPSYLKFIDRITGQKLSTFNRLVLDMFGTEASKGYEHIGFPDLNLKHTTRQFQEDIINWII